MGTPLAPLRCFIDASPRGPRRANPNTRGRGGSHGARHRQSPTHRSSRHIDKVSMLSRMQSRARGWPIRRDTHAGPFCRRELDGRVCSDRYGSVSGSVTDRYGPVSVVPQSGPLGKVCNLAVAASGGKCVARRARAAHPITRCYEMPPLGTEAVHTPLASVNGFSL